MEQRIVKLQISNEYIIGSGVSVGAVGSHDDVLLEMDFRHSAVWAGTTRRAIFANALGENRIVIVLTTNLLEEGQGEIYLVPFPQEAKDVAGECFLTVEGFVTDGNGKEIVRCVTEEARFRVLPSKLYTNDSDPVTPSQAEQLQAEIDDIKQKIILAAQAANSAKDAEEAKTAAEEAKDRAELNARNARAMAEGGKYETKSGEISSYRAVPGAKNYANQAYVYVEGGTFDDNPFDDIPSTIRSDGAKNLANKAKAFAEGGSYKELEKNGLDYEWKTKTVEKGAKQYAEAAEDAASRSAESYKSAAASAYSASSYASETAKNAEDASSAASSAASDAAFVRIAFSDAIDNIRDAAQNEIQRVLETGGQQQEVLNNIGISQVNRIDQAGDDAVAAVRAEAGNFMNHAANEAVHVTEAERAAWNAKQDAPFKPAGDAYLKFSSAEPFTVSFNLATKTWDSVLQFFSPDKVWTEWDGTDAISSVESFGEQVVYLRGIGNTVITGRSRSEGSNNFVLNGTGIKCTGNIETLLDYATVEAGEHPPMSEYCFCLMFDGCTGLKQAPALPATELEYFCYGSMFYGCTGLTTAPSLPATKLADACYLMMFGGCTGLQQAPALPAMKLEPDCYGGMFASCTGLKQAPALPATELAPRCYYWMFVSCTSLTQIPTLPATTLANICYGWMFEDCTSIKLSDTKTGQYSKEYRIPCFADGTVGSDSVVGMFTGTGGTFTGSPDINKIYYLSDENSVVGEPDENAIVPICDTLPEATAGMRGRLTIVPRDGEDALMVCVLVGGSYQWVSLTGAKIDVDDTQPILGTAKLGTMKLA